MDVETPDVFPFVDNTIFKQAKCVYMDDSGRIVKDRVYWEPAIGVTFKTRYKVITSYMTFFGPYVNANNCVYADTTRSLEIGTYRLFNCRQPVHPNPSATEVEKAEWDALSNDMAYRHAQEMTLGDCRAQDGWNEVLNKWISFYQSEIREKCIEMEGELEAIESFSEEVHIKRELRRCARRELTDTGWLLHKTCVQRIKVKFKKHERAKSGKKGRVTADLTSSGCIVAGPALNNVKTAFVKAFTHDNFELRFVKSADVGNLSQCFKDLIDGTTNLGLFHSDDSCIAVLTTAGRMVWNLDIATCDISHCRALMELLRTLCADSASASTCIAKGLEQLLLPIEVKNPASKAEKVNLTHSEPVLFSGSVLTTLINNIASSMIYLRFFYLLRSRVVSPKEVTELLIRAAQDVGYIVTLDHCNIPEKIQFLKHSPVQTDSGYTAILNLAVILRILGNCVGDVPTKGFKDDMRGRCHKYTCDVIAGLEHAGAHSLLDMLRDKYPHGEAIEFEKAVNATYERVEDEDLIRRYGSSLADYEDFIKTFGEAGFGDEVNSKFCDDVFKADYGYSW